MGTPLTALNRIAAATATTQPRMNLLWATVATVDPLTVILDHDPDETPRPAINAVGALRVGQRVTVSKTDQLLTVTGPVAGELTGGNSDGNWIRHVNGIQECWQRAQTTSAATSPYGDLHLLRHQWVFPAPFLEPPTVTVGRLQLGAGAALIASTEDPTTTQCVLRAMDVVARPQGTPLYVTATAIGRWK